MAFYFSTDLRRIAKKGVNKRWLKFKRLYFMLEEEARKGNTSLVIVDLTYQEIMFLKEEGFKLSKVDGGELAYNVIWSK